MSKTGTESIEVLADQLAKVSESSVAIEQQIMQATANFQTQLKTMRAQESELRAAILEGMKANGVKKFENDVLTLTYIAPTKRSSIDVAALRAAEPELAEKYTRESVVKESLRIKVKEQE